MTENEVKGAGASQEDVASVLKQIAESNALGDRKLISRLFNTFGSEDFCQICSDYVRSKYHGKYIARNPSRYNIHNELKEGERVVPDDFMPSSDTLEADGKTIHLYRENPNAHTPLPKIDVSITLRDKPFLYENDGESWSLSLETCGLRIWHSGAYRVRNANNAPLYVLKALVKSGRLPTFFAYLQEEAKKSHAQRAKKRQTVRKIFTEDHVIGCLSSDLVGRSSSQIRDCIGCSDSTSEKLIASLLEKGRIYRTNVNTETKPFYLYFLPTTEKTGED